MNYKLKKVFKRSDMPENVSQKLFEHLDDSPRESYVEWNVHDWHKPISEHKGGEILYQDNDTIIERGDDPVSEWLVENGAEEGEEVLIDMYY